MGKWESIDRKLYIDNEENFTIEEKKAIRTINTLLHNHQATSTRENEDKNFIENNLVWKPRNAAWALIKNKIWDEIKLLDKISPVKIEEVKIWVSYKIDWKKIRDNDDHLIRNIFQIMDDINNPIIGRKTWEVRIKSDKKTSTIREFIDKINKSNFSQEVKDKLLQDINFAYKQVLSQDIKKTVISKNKIIYEKKDISQDQEESEKYKEEDTNIKKTEIKKLYKKLERPNSIDDIALPLFSNGIRGLDSWDNTIPSNLVGKIKVAIQNLWQYQTMRIIGTTDWDRIESEFAKKRNKDQYVSIYKRYIDSWWKAPTYENLLNSDQDPQNTILWYARAMSGVLSLWLTREEIKKVEIWNKLGSSPDNANERWFDIAINHQKDIDIPVVSGTFAVLYDFLGKINKQHIGRSLKSFWDNQEAFNLIAETSLDANNSAIYQKVMPGIANAMFNSNNLTPEIEKKVKNRIDNYLSIMVQMVWWEYNNGSRKVLRSGVSNEQMFLIKWAKWLAKDEFIDLMSNKNLDVISDKKLSNWYTIEDYINGWRAENLWVDILEFNWKLPKINWVTDMGGHGKSILDFHWTLESWTSNIDSKFRRLLPEDEEKLGLYFTIKNSI